MKYRAHQWMAYFSFTWGITALFIGFHQLTTGSWGDFWNALLYLNLGLVAIFVSGRISQLLPTPQSRPQRAFTTTRRRMSTTAFGLLLLLLPLNTTGWSSPVEFRNVEFGTTYIQDSGGEQFQNHFALLKLRYGNEKLMKLWLQQTNKSDPWGKDGLLNFRLETSPADWIGLQLGYQQMPVGSIRLAQSLGRFHFAIGGGREAILSRSNAIADKIDLVSGYLDVSVSLPWELRLVTSVGGGKYRDGVLQRSFSAMISRYQEFGRFKLTLHTGYSQRLLSTYSPYYWSPEAYREFFIAPDIGIELNGFWLYVNLSVDRILEERYTGDTTGITGWGANGEVSFGFRAGPGYLYITGRAWNSGIQRYTSGYRGTILQMSYELSL